VTAPQAIVNNTIQGLAFGAGQQFENLTMIPITGGGDGVPGYITLDEALASGDIEITEVSDAGQVSELKVTVKGASPVLLVDGEELVGAKQNRVLNLTILAAARQTTRVPVSCVEAGRWRHSSARFASSPRTQFSEGRAARMQHVTASLSATGSRESDQSEVWSQIAHKSERLRVRSATSAMSDIYDSLDRTIDAYVGAATPVANQVGAVFLINGKPAGMDLFDSPSTWRKLAAKLVRGYALDAIDRRQTTSDTSETPLTPQRHLRDTSGTSETPQRPGVAAGFAQTVQSAEASVFPATGEGEDVRLKGLAVAGAALVAHERVVHMSAFPA